MQRFAAAAAAVSVVVHTQDVHLLLLANAEVISPLLLLQCNMVARAAAS